MESRCKLLKGMNVILNRRNIHCKTLW